MKDRKFWEGRAVRTQNIVRVLECLMESVETELSIRTKLLPPYRNKSKEVKLNSRLGYLRRKKKALLARIGFYQGRVLALEKRTRYQRILRSPVI